MKDCEAMVAYTPQGQGDPEVTGRIVVVHVGAKSPGWAGKHRRTLTSLGSDWKDGVGFPTPVERVFQEFNAIVVRDRLDPQRVHDAFLAIDEYRHRIAPDMRGAENEDGSKPDPFAIAL